MGEWLLKMCYLASKIVLQGGGKSEVNDKIERLNGTK